MKYALPRYIPKSAVKVTDKRSDAIAYLYNSAKTVRPCAIIYWGKQAKPISHSIYRTEAERAGHVASYFKARQEIAADKAAYRAERTAWQPDYKIGDILNTCWGYDQTNREFFEVVEVRGKHVILRELAQETTGEGWGGSSKCVPLPGKYIGEPIRKLAQKGGVRISECQWASRTDTTTVAGVKVVQPMYWSSDH